MKYKTKKYRIKKEFSSFADGYVFFAYRVPFWLCEHFTGVSALTPEECEERLLQYIRRDPPEVVKELEI